MPLIMYTELQNVPEALARRLQPSLHTPLVAARMDVELTPAGARCPCKQKINLWHQLHASIERWRLVVHHGVEIQEERGAVGAMTATMLVLQEALLLRVALTSEPVDRDDLQVVLLLPMCCEGRQDMHHEVTPTVGCPKVQLCTEPGNHGTQPSGEEQLQISRHPGEPLSTCHLQGGRGLCAGSARVASGLL